MDAKKFGPTWTQMTEFGPFEPVQEDVSIDRTVEKKIQDYIGIVRWHSCEAGKLLQAIIDESNRLIIEYQAMLGEAKE